LDKAGPRGRRNRDAAGLIPEAPWIKPPRLDVPLPKIVSPEHLDAAYRASALMGIPRYPGIKPGPWWRALIAVAYNTGLRARTLFEMRMEHIDWKNRRLVIPPGFMKAHRAIVLPLNAVAFDHLMTIRTDRELVFPFPHERQTFYRLLHRLLDAACIPRAEHFGLHALRKTLATAMWESSPQAAQYTLGHSDIRTTKAFYTAGSGLLARAMDELPQPAAFLEHAGAAS
jgi:integrase